MVRRARKPFTFSNGVTVPPRTYVAAHLHATHRDGAFYERPEEFDGFRFVEEETKTADGAVNPRHMLHTTSKIYLPFGHGKHAWYVFSCSSIAVYARG